MNQWHHYLEVCIPASMTAGVVESRLIAVAERTQEEGLEESRMSLSLAVGTPAACNFQNQTQIHKRNIH